MSRAVCRATWLVRPGRRTGRRPGWMVAGSRRRPPIEIVRGNRGRGGVCESRGAWVRLGGSSSSRRRRFSEAAGRLMSLLHRGARQAIPPGLDAGQGRLGLAPYATAVPGQGGLDASVLVFRDDCRNICHRKGFLQCPDRHGGLDGLDDGHTFSNPCRGFDHLVAPGAQTVPCLSIACFQ